MTRIIIDTDAGVDDAVAIIYAARCPEVRIEMITTVSGNVPVKEVTQNVLYLRELLDLDVPVLSGAEVPRDRKLVTAPEVHGDDGVGGYRLSHGIAFRDWETGDAAMRIVRAAEEFGKQLTIVSLGPMTNIAEAVSIDAEAIRNVGGIIQMGGVFSGYGNTTEHTEFNIFVDPEAAAFVLSNDIKIRFVPLDITEQLFLPAGIIDSLLKQSRGMNPKLGSLLQKAIHYYINYHRSTDKLDGCYLHDPIALAAAIKPDWFRFVDSFVSIETKGDLTAGMTISDLRKTRRRGNSRIAVAFDALKFLTHLTDRVFGAKVDRSVARSECLTQRFIPDFRNRLPKPIL